MKLSGLAVLLLLCGCTSEPTNPQNSDWELLGASSDMQHHSPLTQINRETIGTLDLAWAVDMPTM